MERVKTVLIRLLRCQLLALLLFSTVGAQHSRWFLDLDPTYLPQRMDRLSASSDGFYWVGGARGLYRFTEGSIEAIELKLGQRAATKDKIIQSKVIEDDEGKLWFSTYSALYRYDPLTEQMSPHPIEANGLPLESGYQPFYFNPATRELWLRAGDRLWARHVTSGKHRPLTEPSTAVHYSAFSLGDGAYRICGSRWMFPGLEVFDVLPGQPPAKAREVVPREEIICSLQLSADSVLIGTKTGLKLLQFSGEKAGTAYLSEEAPRKNVSSLVRQEDGRILAAFVGSGIFTVDPEAGSVRPMLAEGDQPGTSSPDQLLATPSGKILSTQLNTGILVIDRASQGVTMPVAASGIRKIARDAADNFYWLLNNGQVWRQSPTGARTNLLADVAPNQLPATGDMAVFRDSLIVAGNKHLWLITPDGRQHYPLAEDFIDRLMARPGRPPLLVTRLGIQSIHFVGDQLTLRPIPGLESSDQSFFSHFFPLVGNEFLLNRQPSALWRVRAEDDAYAVSEKISGVGEIYCALQTRSGQIYAGGSEGLFLLGEAGGQKISLKAGLLPQAVVQTMAEDRAGNLWLGTDAGLLAYRPGADGFTPYFGQLDGLPSERFTDAPALALPDGRIGMVSDAGVIRLSPEDLLARENHRDPYIADIWVNEEPLESDTSSHYLRRLELNYLRNTLKFKVAAKGFGGSAASGIQYQMLGYEDKPAFTDFNTTIRYPNLPPGEYTLQLTAINQNGLPSGVRELAVVIYPPFSQTLTFKLLVGLGLLLLVGGGYAILLRRERARQLRIQEQQARLAAERDRIAGEVHDDLGGQLSSIMYLSEELLLTEAAPGTERELHRINELSRNSLQNVRDIIFALDNRRSSVASLGEQIRAAGMEFFADHKIDFRYTEALEHPDHPLSSRQKRNLLSVVKEAWHNTAKHAAAAVVRLDFRQAGDRFSLLIADDGRGFDPAAGSAPGGTGGYGLDNMHDKVAAIGGRLRIDASPGGGTTLTLEAPLAAKT